MSLRRQAIDSLVLKLYQSFFEELGWQKWKYWFLSLVGAFIVRMCFNLKSGTHDDIHPGTVSLTGYPGIASTCTFLQYVVHINLVYLFHPEVYWCRGTVRKFDCHLLVLYIYKCIEIDQPGTCSAYYGRAPGF